LKKGLNEEYSMK
jgi:hypothetical protein